ncbi:cytochrome b/b6 domain-containing protein [Pedobacter sp. Du54]|uniref:cytochrome b/b6 domain-containing protein n=1 Tax=Pedobacter anseongensis TaxID=3133439 RepID=UPI0030A3ED7D
MKTNPSHPKKNSVYIRIWHWLNVALICGSLLTVLINSTLFDGRPSSAFIKNELQQAGANVSQEQARAVQHGFEDKIWEIHIYIGYALAALVLYRILMELFESKPYKFFPKLKRSFRLYFTTKIRSNGYEFGIKLLYLVFYSVIFLMVITGLSVAFDDELGFSKSFSHTLKEFHGFCMYIIIAFSVLHIAGVFFAERKDKKGIVSDMINGGVLDNHDQ